jgi:alkylation response protein AidB-like acyl-CoA dehydrogenase
MRFDLNAEQHLLRQTARELFTVESPTRHIRALYDRDRFARPIWNAMAAHGWLGALISEEHGGLGLSLADLFPILEEAGRAVAPVPLVEAAVIVPMLIQRLADTARAREWLTCLADGSQLATIAWYEDADVLDPPRLSVSAEPGPAGWTLTGTKELVAFGADADLIVVLASTPAGGRDGLTQARVPGLFVVPRTSPGLQVTRASHTDITVRFARLRFEGVHVPADHALGQPGWTAKVLAAAVQAARIALCAEMVGGAERVVEMSIAYAKQRIQFDRPIGSFQAIKHKLVDMHVQAEWIRGLAYAATPTLETDDQDDPIVEVAKAMCNDAYRFITHEGIQVHGGIGFTWEHDLHLYYKRALRYACTLGTSPQLMYEVGLALTQGRGYEEYTPTPA